MKWTLIVVGKFFEKQSFCFSLGKKIRFYTKPKKNLSSILIIIHSPLLKDYASILTSFTDVLHRTQHVFTEINEAVFSPYDSSLAFSRGKSQWYTIKLIV